MKTFILLSFLFTQPASAGLPALVQQVKEIIVSKSKGQQSDKPHREEFRKNPCYGVEGFEFNKYASFELLKGDPSVRGQVRAFRNTGPYEDAPLILSSFTWNSGDVRYSSLDEFFEKNKICNALQAHRNMVQRDTDRSAGRKITGLKRARTELNIIKYTVIDAARALTTSTTYNHSGPLQDDSLQEWMAPKAVADPRNAGIIIVPSSYRNRAKNSNNASK